MATPPATPQQTQTPTAADPRLENGYEPGQEPGEGLNGVLLGRKTGDEQQAGKAGGDNARQD